MPSTVTNDGKTDKMEEGLKIIMAKTIEGNLPETEASRKTVPSLVVAAWTAAMAPCIVAGVVNC